MLNDPMVEAIAEDGIEIPEAFKNGKFALYENVRNRVLMLVLNFYTFLYNFIMGFIDALITWLSYVSE